MGILLTGGSGNVVQGNYIGVDSTGTLTRSNHTGIFIFNSANNLIGGTNPAARNVISGNGSEGVEVGGPGNLIQGNYIGTNAIGSAALPNGRGIDIGGFAPVINNTIGGTAAGAGNLISGNQTGVNCTSGNVIQGNLIGTNAAGNAAIGNSTGIVAGTSTLVGGTVTGARNIISGNSGDGVSIGGPGSLLQGNFIGTNSTGTAVLGNGGSGVVAGNGTLIGGTTPEARNVISGNGGFGNISLGSNGSGSQATVQGNYIGTDVTGNVALNNPQAGIWISSVFNVIGGLMPGAQNVIAGNRVGIQVGGAINTIQGNIIGLNALGVSPLPNSLAGIRISDSSNNMIGGTDTGAGNRIGFNTGPGVSVVSGTGNSIRGNSIFSNNGLAIDLSPTGVTANDLCDSDSGANNRQNYPVLVSALVSAGSTEIEGTLDSTSNTTFRVDFYASLSCDPSANGEGEVFLGSTLAETDATCSATVKAILPLVVESGRVITATATTEAGGDTSEFSTCLVVCGYQLSASSASFSADGGMGTVGVTCPNGCAWSAATNDTWITITSGGSGSGNGSVAYTVSANSTGNVRTGTMTIAGQIFTVNQSSDPTAVKLESFSSVAYTDGVFIEWKTGLELANLGFNVYREQNGRRTRITPEIVAGSALIAGDRTRLTAGQVYGWWDAGVANCGSKNGDCQSVSYWLEDIDLDGTRTEHGPITPTLVGGLPPTQSTAALLSNVGKGEPRVSQVRASQADLTRPSHLQFETQWDVASKPALKLTIREEGWYRLTQPELLAAGLDPKGDPRNLQLYLWAEERPLLVSGEQDGSFDQNDAIEFYATGQDLPSTDACIYWLVSGERPGKRISVVRSEGKPGGANSFPYTVELKEKTIYFASLRNGDAENFFGRVITSQPVEQELTLRHLDSTVQGDAVFEVALQGVTDLPGTVSDHQVKLTLNGTQVGTMIFDGRQNLVERFSVPQSQLREGDNVVTLVAEGGASDISLVDHVRITYRHTYTAEQDALRMTVGKSQTIEGFSDGSIRVLDITNAWEPQELLGLIEERKVGGFAVTVQVTGAEPRVLMALTVNRIKHPVSIVANRPSSWQAKDHGADLLILTNREFAGTLAPLKALRQKQGLSVEAVDVEDIYDEFGFGQKSPGAIKNFLIYAHTSWKQAPRFVLFVGDASYDPRNYLGAGDFDFVPSKLIDTTYLETASDDWFVDFDDDGLPEMYVGRLPVRSAAEAAAVVSKLVAYDSSPSKTPSGQRSVLLVADRNDGFNFEEASRQLRALAPADTNIQEIFRGRLDDESAKKQLVNAINSGQTIVNYSGHGSTNVWRSLFSASDIESLSNKKRLSLFVTMTCLNGFFQDPLNESLAAGLLRSSQGGAVAVWASSGLTSPAQQALMNQQMYRLMFAGTASLTIGEITSRAKASVTDGDVRRTWILFGDPTTMLR